jgi:hypothetical protein
MQVLQAFLRVPAEKLVRMAAANIPVQGDRSRTAALCYASHKLNNASYAAANGRMSQLFR